MESKSMFVELLGDYPIIRVLDFLIENDLFDYSKKDISRNANVSWNTLETFWAKLEKNKVVAPTRKVGRAQMFKLDTSNDFVKQLIALDNSLIKKSFKEIETEKTRQKAIA